MTDITLLDCTLRDGGFYTAWDFPQSTVHAYLQAMDGAGVDYAEIGYRSFVRNGFAGAWRYCSEALLKTLPELTHTKLGVMIDGKELFGQEHRIAELFVPASESRVSLVRIAVKASHLPSAIEQIRLLHNLGYTTCINLMALATVPADERPALLTAMAECDADAYYIADSYGSMIPSDIAEVADVIDGINNDSPWGVHLHNNLELAFANALMGMSRGATWIDTSVMGMGRGPGNLKTELFVQHLQTRLGLARFRTDPLYALIGRYWSALHAIYHWGPSPPYVLSGHLSVHPTYAQELLGSGRYTHHEVTAILTELHRSGAGGSFKADALAEAIGARFTPTAHDRVSPGPIPGFDDALPGVDWSAREVLILGRGPSATEHEAALNAYIAGRNPVVLECNFLPGIAASTDHACVFSLLDNARTQGASAQASGKSVVCAFDPAMAGLTAGVGADAENGTAVVSAAYTVQPGGFKPAARPPIVPHDVVSMVAIALAIGRGAQRISVAGFDGYPDLTDDRGRRQQAEMEDFLDLLIAYFPNVELSALTRTAFGLPERSIYGALFDLEIGVKTGASA